MKTFKQFLRNQGPPPTAKPGSMRLSAQQKQKLAAVIRQFKFQRRSELSK
jgi:hypothetical protein